MDFMTVKKTSKLSGSVSYTYFEDSAFIAAKRDAAFYTRYMKGMPLIYYFVKIEGRVQPSLSATSPQQLPLYNGHFFGRTVHTLELVSTSLQ